MVIEELAGIGERFDDDERNRDKQKARKPVIDGPKDYGPLQFPVNPKLCASFCHDQTPVWFQLPMACSILSEES